MSDEHVLILGPKNCENAIGWPWRHVRDHARRLGLPLLRLGRKQGVDARAFLAALASEQGSRGDAEPATAAEAAACVRKALRRQKVDQ